jgi:hypothetical protein
MEGVGEVYEWPKYWSVQEVFQLWSASFRMPLGLGKVMIHEYIVVAFGFDGGKDIAVAGVVSNRKFLGLVQIV